MKKRVTVLLGAGAMVEATGVSTESITEKVLEECRDFRLDSGKEVLRSFIEELTPKFKARNIDRSINFEDLYGVLESLIDYKYRKYNISGSVVLSELKEEFKSFDSRRVYSLIRHFLKVVNCYVADYDRAFDRNGKWMGEFFHEYIKREECALDIFNLNYDTWIEQILGDKYTDGFVPIEGYGNFNRFSVSEYLNATERHKVSHLHGQICFEAPEFKDKDINRYAYEEQGYCLYKYNDFEGARDYRERLWKGDISSQSGYTIPPANIITGRLKTDKMLWSPMQVYVYGFTKALMENEDLLIIGYGFGDYYINNLLYRYLQRHGGKKRVSIVSFCSREDYADVMTISRYPFGNMESIFVQCVFDGKIRFKRFERDSKYVSENGNVKLYIDGFKRYCEEYMKNP